MAVNAWKSRSQLAPKIGKGKYVLAEYEKIKRITMPLGDKHLVYVTTEPQANHAYIISGITEGFSLESLRACINYYSNPISFEVAATLESQEKE
jgi:hypothetical protein